MIQTTNGTRTSVLSLVHAGETQWPQNNAFDARLDVMDMVHHTFHHYDTRVQFNGHNFVQTNDHGNIVDVVMPMKVVVLLQIGLKLV